jgi:hypothetical protein
MTALSPREQSRVLARYKRSRGRGESSAWQGGVSNQIDRRIDQGLSAVEIAHELEVPRWVAVERFAAREAMA